MPERVVILTSQVAGQVQSVSVVEGQAVHKGDEILRLDDRSAQVQRAKMRASVEEAQAVLARLKRGPRSEEIEAARQDARKAQTVAQSIRLKIEAMKALHEKQEMADVQFERVKSELQAAEAEGAAVEARLKLLEAGTRPEEIAEAEAKLAAAQADLAASELAVQLHHLTSPIEGVVTELSARQGMAVDPLTKTGTLADLSTLFARVQIPAAHLANVRAGASVDVRATALPNHVFKGAVIRLGKQADLQTGNVEALASVANKTGDLRPGLACQVRVWLPTIPNVLVIPVAAIADHDGTPVVTVVRDNQAYETEVVLGVQTREQAQVTKGLSPGDLVAVQGGYGLPEGCPCSVTMESDAENKSPTATAKAPGG
jgi:multidrug efflux pump subunit AcrA (membrane-fusion protein)